MGQVSTINAQLGGGFSDSGSSLTNALTSDIQFQLDQAQQANQGSSVGQPAGETLLTHQVFESYIENLFLKRERSIAIQHQDSIRRESGIPTELVLEDGLYYFKLKDDSRRAEIFFQGYLNTPADGYSFSRQNPEASPRVQSARALSSILSSAFTDDQEQSNPVHQFALVDNGRSLTRQFPNGQEVFHIRNLSEQSGRDSVSSIYFTSGQRFYAPNGVPVTIGFEFVSNN